MLNEDEHALAPDQGQMYTICFDAIKAEVAKNNPSIIAVGPELCWVCTKDPLDYMKYFLNASNHDDGLAPPITSYHHGMFWPSGKWQKKTYSGESALFEQWDAFYESNVLLLETWKKELSSETEFVLNEYGMAPVLLLTLSCTRTLRLQICDSPNCTTTPRANCCCGAGSSRSSAIGATYRLFLLAWIRQSAQTGRIQRPPVPRSTHFSDEFITSLGSV
eukprot:COSAG02_NODE_317_length_24808_cov_120.564329_25_plen_219_part_00